MFMCNSHKINTLIHFVPQILQNALYFIHYTLNCMFLIYQLLLLLAKWSNDCYLSDLDVYN